MANKNNNRNKNLRERLLRLQNTARKYTKSVCVCGGGDMLKYSSFLDQQQCSSAWNDLNPDCLASFCSDQ